MQSMLKKATDFAENKLSTPGTKGYTSLANQKASRADGSDRFYDEQLQSDGWHLDEVDDDDELDFALPPTRRKPQGGILCPGCCSEAVGCVIS